MLGVHLDQLKPGAWPVQAAITWPTSTLVILLPGNSVGSMIRLLRTRCRADPLRLVFFRRYLPTTPIRQQCQLEGQQLSTAQSSST
jgi:hypothetical protein